MGTVGADMQVAEQQPGSAAIYKIALGLSSTAEATEQNKVLNTAITVIPMSVYDFIN